MLWLRLLSGLLFAALVASDAVAQTPAVRPEVGKPIQAASDLIKAKRGREAIARVREAQAVSNKTDYETYLVNRVLGLAAIAAGDPATAARAFESVVASPAAPDAERRQFLAAAAGQYYAAKDYGKAADLSARYLKDGSDRAVRTLHVQSLYLGGNYAAAAKALSADIDADENAGRTPSEDQLQLLWNAYQQQKDAAGSARALERLLAHYPKPDYWLSALQGVAALPGFADRLAIDLARLKIATGSMRTTAEYFDAVQLALHDGFPLEAQAIMEKGYKARLLGTGPEAERHKRLRALVDKDLAEDKKKIAQDEPRKDGKTMLNDGFNYVLRGKSAKGIELMEQGLKAGSGFKRPDHAKLQLAYGYHLAGLNQKAIAVYRTVQGNDGAAAIARLWITYLRRAS